VDRFSGLVFVKSKGTAQGNANLFPEHLEFDAPQNTRALGAVRVARVLVRL